MFGPVDDESWRQSVERLRTMAPDARWLGGHPPLDSAS
jgi:hypothetical protein